MQRKQVDQSSTALTIGPEDMASDGVILVMSRSF